MSDLISRSELIKHFEAVQSQEDAIGLDFVAIIDEIKEQPTAYSVDKVIKELEERADFLKDCTKYGNKNAKQQAESYNTIMMYEVADLVDDLIEIVKKGCVSDDVSDDVCEWKVFDNSLTDEPQWVYETTCGKYVGEEHTSKAFVYCPYCGKKIKIVGD